MSAATLSAGLSRRSFLRGAALTAGLALAAPLVARASAAQPQPLTIGLLVPRSNLYPALGASLLLGARRYLADAGGQIAGRPVRLQTAPLGIGAEAAVSAIDAALAAGADAVAGVVSPEFAAQLDPVLQHHGTLFFALDAGANLPRLHQQSARIVSSSLGVWQSAYALGAWAAAHVGRRAAMALSFYESGYDAPYAFQLGFEHAGGQVVASAVTHAPGRPADGPAALWRRLADAEPDLVYAAHVGEQALDLVRGYRASGLAGQLPLLGSAFLVDERLLPLQGSAAEGIRSALAYDGTPRLTAGPAVAADGPHPIEGFALLGYEAAGMIAAALEAAGGNGRDAARMRAGLLGAPLASPRGQLGLDPEEASMVAPIHLRVVSGQAQRSAAVLPAVSLRDQALAGLRSTPRTGWLYSYLCI